MTTRRGRQSRSTRPRGAAQPPRLPHERDESADSQELQEADQRELMQQASDDIEDGLEDTDRGPVLDRVYRENLKQPRKR